MTIEELNSRFGIVSQLRFVEDASGLIIAEIENTKATARLCLQGAHLMSWQPHDMSVPVVWLSEAAKLLPGKSIRGGVPVCWPWFGNHESQSGFPAHGHARTTPWEVLAAGIEPDGATRITLRLVESAQTRAMWPHDCTLELTAIVGESLKIALVTTNTGDTDFMIGEALHTHFRIGDIASVRVRGLENCVYFDKVDNMARRQQSGAVVFSGETDRVYVNTGSDCIIEDAALRRRIRIAKTHSQSTVVWTPWQEKADKMGDLGGNNGWRQMLCVESANAMENCITVPAGKSHALTVEYSAGAL